MGSAPGVQATTTATRAASILLPFPPLPEEDRETLRMLIRSLRTYAEREINERQVDTAACLPDAALAGARELGLFGLIIPADLGGVGLSNQGYARALQEVGAVSEALGATVSAHQALACKAILLFGNDEQKQKYMPKAASGEWIVALAMTEPNAGSVTSNTATVAKKAPGGWLINGQKTFITNGSWASVYVTFARTEVEVGGTKQDRVSAFIVDKSPGVHGGVPMHKLGIRGSNTTEVYYDDCFVPEENLIGSLGTGLTVVRGALSHGRMGLAAGCVGGDHKAIRMAINFAKDRIHEQGKSILTYGLIREKIAHMMVETYTSEAMVSLTAALIDRGWKDPVVESGACKVYCTDALWRAVNESLQIAGGYGYMQDYNFELLMRDCRVNPIFEGTNEVIRLTVGMNCMQGIRMRLNKIAGTFQQAGDVAAVTPACLEKDVHEYEQWVTAADAALDAAVARHKNLVRDRQCVQRRIADMFIDVYGMAACIARAIAAVTKKGEAGATRELLMTRLFCAEAAHRLRAVSDELREGRDDDSANWLAITDDAYEVGGYPLDMMQ
jgi:acyl-CoA dehydrogenase family member 9